MYSDTFLAGYAVLTSEHWASFWTSKRGAMAGIDRITAEDAVAKWC